MYSVVKNFLELLDRSGTQTINFTQDDIRTAIAVLYYRVVVGDGRIKQEEMHHFRKVLSETLDVSEDEFLLFEETVLDHVRTERSLFPFTTIIKRLPVERRLEILRHMEQISVSDKELHEFELNLMVRTAQLLDIEEE